MSYPFRVTDATVDVLGVLLSGDDDLYGLKIAQTIGRPTGSVAPILRRLEGCNWVTSTWEQSNERTGPRRRFYQLSAEHAADARALVAERRPAPTTPKHTPLRPGWVSGR
ncbi:hypothetical protein GCM10010390_92330 [Streptomyces mordarskii]|uniref:Transcription regulator PadR N-terminal domain-containing protein n=1 Tax=Streptomyces mordarskii TaxID=1226758 RepID=A0ABP3PWR2_9ACTN